jgi:hypothetical protein
LKSSGPKNLPLRSQSLDKRSQLESPPLAEICNRRAIVNRYQHGYDLQCEHGGFEIEGAVQSIQVEIRVVLRPFDGLAMTGLNPYMFWLQVLCEKSRAHSVGFGSRNPLDRGYLLVE